jgi:hypothetical protein
MSDYLLIEGLCTLGCGTACLAVVLPLLLGVVGRNRFYGIRSRKTLSSHDLWREVNRRAAFPLVLVSLPVFLAGGGAVFAALHYKIADGPLQFIWFVPLCLVGPWALYFLLKRLVWTKTLRNS